MSQYFSQRFAAGSVNVFAMSANDHALGGLGLAGAHQFLLSLNGDETEVAVAVISGDFPLELPDDDFIAPVHPLRPFYLPDGREIGVAADTGNVDAVFQRGFTDGQSLRDAQRAVVYGDLDVHISGRRHGPALKDWATPFIQPP